MNACVADSATKSELIDEAANSLRHTQKLPDVLITVEAGAKLLVSLRHNHQEPKGKTSRRKRRRVRKNDVEKASAVIKDRIRTADAFSDVINLLGECMFYESLFIWQRMSLDRFKNTRCKNSSALIGNLMLVLQKNYKSLLKLFMGLPSLQASKHYPVVVRSEDVSNQALQRARHLALGLTTTREFTCIKDISPYCEKQIKVYYIPIEAIMIPIEETCLSCLNIVH